MNRAASLAVLADRIAACTACGASRPPELRVIGTGPLDASVMLVGEAPGATEEERGAPFVGPAGRMLDEWLAAAGVERSKLRIGNALACRPTQAQPSLDAKLDDLERIPARYKIASVEPMIGPVDFARALRIRELVWFLFGGESGARAKVRPCDLGWIDRGVRQVGDAGRFRFVKQLGAVPIGAVPGCLGCENEMHEGERCRLCGDVVEIRPTGDGRFARVLHLPGKGDDPALWPERLRVQEWIDGSAYVAAGAAC